MKWLLGLLDRARPTFEEGGRLRPLKPVFDAVDSFFFTPLERTSGAPHVRDPLDVKRYMTIAIISVLPCVFASLYFFGLRMLATIAVSYAVGLTVEAIFCIVRKEEFNEGFFVTGMIYPLVLPPNLPLWAVAVGVIFGVVVGKELFGGTGRNLFNPALVGRCFLALAYAKLMVGSYLTPASGGWGGLAMYTTDAVTGATPLSAAKGGQLVEPIRLLWGNVSGSAGETSAIAILAGGAFLLFTRVANWRTVAAILGSFAGLGALLHLVQPAVFGPIGWHMLAGGLLFGSFFMATDPVTSPSTNGGKWAYGIIIGTTVLLIRNLTGYVEGMMFAILLGNIFAPILDEVFIRLRLRRLQNEV
ncbi:MAG: RnfABCDGE type electron transport complex subunit D [Planctomycetota bacterium]|jgi:Na(+)-translocating NADH:ubiquinone oxidoreductase B subunit